MRKHYTLSGLLLCLMTLLTLGASAQMSDCLCFTALEEGSTVTLNMYGTPDAVTLQYSLDERDWYDYTIGRAIYLGNVGEKVYFCYAGEDEASAFSTTLSDYYSFTMSGLISASGNVMSLLNKRSREATTIPCVGCFSHLFEGCDALVSAPELPATLLHAGCYYKMFSGCTRLTTAPALPATTMSNRCYFQMFEGCTSLATAPELPATTLGPYCYQGMFSGCTSLTTAPALPVTTLDNGCYYQMFVGCTSLTAAPELPATTLMLDCYSWMFKDCSKLNVVKVAFKVFSSSTALWLANVSSKGIFICPDDLSTTTRSASNVPAGWSVNGYNLTVSSVGWASMYLPIDVTIPEDVEVYYAASASGDVVTLKPITGIIPAYTGVIVKAAEGTVFFPYTTTAGTPVEGNLFEGVTSATACSADVNYVLAPTTTPDMPWFSNYTGTSLGAFKAYLPKSAVGGASSIQFRFADATAISTVETEVAEDVIYNLAGQRVGSDYRGLVIRNGKKMYNK